MKLLQAFLLTAAISLLNCASSRAQTADQRIQRLSDLAKVWGTAKFMHPYLAYKTVDWDKALIQAIPKVNAAQTSADHAQALNAMLKELGDDQTFAFVDEANKKGPSTINENSEPLRFENGTLYLNAIAAAKKTAQSNTHLSTFNQQFLGFFPKAKALIIDCRTGGLVDGASLYELDYILRDLLSKILDQKVTLGTVRYRIHNGYAPQNGTSSGGYYSGMTTDMPVSLGSDEKKPFKTPPMVVFLDQDSPLATIFSGLQAAGKAIILSSKNDLGMSPITLTLTGGVKVSMRNTEMVAPDGSVGFVPDLVVPEESILQQAIKILSDSTFKSKTTKKISPLLPQVTQQDQSYPQMEFPSEEYRLLALFRFWNVIHYFFPYKHLTGTDWNQVLTKYIPLFEGNKNAPDYRLTAGKMVAEIHDSHGFFQAPRLQNPPQFFMPPTVEAYAENQTYIRGVLDPSSGFKPGDVVLEVDGVPISKILEKFTERVAASTHQSMMRQVHGYGIFRGEKDSKAQFKVKGIDGKIRAINSIRNVSPTDTRYDQFDFSKRKTPSIAILPSGFGYVDLDRLQPGQVDSMFNVIEKSPAVIFDMRGYPNGTAWQIAPRLSSKNQPAAALFDNPLLEAKNIGDSDYSGTSTFNFAQQLPKNTSGKIYKGKIVMLIDESAQSQSEHTALFFEAARPDITFIGTPTAGANGDVTNLTLPGNIRVSFSGHGVRHADGRQLQRLGIQPTIKVAPTIRGILAGRDEILERAVQFLKASNN